LVFGAAPDGQEDICTNPAVFFCENWENRPLGPVWNFVGVGGYKNNGWAVSDSITPDIVNTERVDGTKAIRMVTGANKASGGWIDAAFPNGAAFRTVYWRWYVKYSPNYVWSPEATKHNETVSFDRIAGASGADLGVFNFTSNMGFRTPNVVVAATQKDFVAGNPAAAYFPPNRNGGFSQFDVSRWYCVEARITMNTGALSTDGYIQGWIDGVQYYEYPNVNIVSLHGDNPTHSGFFLASYWNCIPGGPDGTDCSRSPHPEIYRYMDNLVGSTQRIGCLGSSPSPSPAVQTPSGPSSVIVQ